VTVVETVPLKKESDESDAEKKEDEEAEEEKPPATEKKTSVYELRVADRSPIGDDAKVYVCAGDDAVVEQSSRPRLISSSRSWPNGATCRSRRPMRPRRRGLN